MICISKQIFTVIKISHRLAELRDLSRLPKEHTIEWLAFHEVHGEVLISDSSDPKLKSGCIVWLIIVDNRSVFPTEKNTNIFFCRRVLLSHFRSVWKGNTKLTSLLYLYHEAFYYKLLNQLA